MQTLAVAAPLDSTWLHSCAAVATQCGPGVSQIWHVVVQQQSTVESIFVATTLRSCALLQWSNVVELSAMTQQSFAVAVRVLCVETFLCTNGSELRVLLNWIFSQDLSNHLFHEITLTFLFSSKGVAWYNQTFLYEAKKTRKRIQVCERWCLWCLFITHVSFLWIHQRFDNFINSPYYYWIIYFAH